ncbi:hypothetical protein QOZ88_19350 [Blastococcus sp. BMG 814]|uniref:PH domain-containing protein n=1 Tax=Blastococcus carthaginiensis TaxID=3050034 RepID=A0ABT9IIA0_9ACTN|nr:hypothetical protein [Blastococcus carthaginiensis]MDP5184795.1 hypothetical protein [Blastococcus carthaginiensis]
MANILRFQLHGPSSEPLPVEIEATDEATSETWLEQFAAWMRTGEVRDLPFGSDGGARINFSRVWAVTYEPPGQVHFY